MRKYPMAAALAALCTPALAADPAPAPPPFRPDRAAEDYQYLRDPARRGDWSDVYKFIHLDDGGDHFLSLGGEFRERVEMFDAARFGLGGSAEDTYLLQRILLHADLRLGESVRFFAQLGSHEAVGKKVLAPPDENRLDVQQLYVELKPTASLAARVGRQEMIFNPPQRFVSFRDATNVRQNFDGARLTWSRGDWRAEAFLVRPVMTERGIFDDARNPDQSFGGIYLSHRLGATSSLDAYWFRLGRDDLAPEGLDERRHGFGLRAAGADGPFDWDGEIQYQVGELGARDIDAWAASIDLGYAPAATTLKPRFGLRFDAGSGDGDPADERIGGFHPFFPSGPYFNEANLTSWTNLVAIRPSIRIEPVPRLTLAGAAQFKWRESVDDAVHVGPTVPLAATLSNEERRIGEVFTIDAQYQWNRNFAFRLYYLHHSAGPAISDAGGRSVDFVMGSATFRF